MDRQHHCHIDIIRRSKGKSVMATVAYDHAIKVSDLRQGIEFDYTPKARGVIASYGIIPNAENGFSEIKPDQREQVWNLLDASYKRKDAQTAREIEIGLPHDLSHSERLELVKKICQSIAQEYGCMTDAAIHLPSRKGDQRNHHVHILVSACSVTALNDGLIFGKKIDRLDNYYCERRKLPNIAETIRPLTCDLLNQAMEAANLQERYDHRTLAAQGLKLIPTIHEGPVYTRLRQKGVIAGRSEINDDIAKINEHRTNAPESLPVAPAPVAAPVAQPKPANAPESPPVAPTPVAAPVAQPKPALGGLTSYLRSLPKNAPESPPVAPAPVAAPVAPPNPADTPDPLDGLDSRQLAAHWRSLIGTKQDAEQANAPKRAAAIQESIPSPTPIPEPDFAAMRARSEAAAKKRAQQEQAARERAEADAAARAKQHAEQAELERQKQLALILERCDTAYATWGDAYDKTVNAASMIGIPRIESEIAALDAQGTKPAQRGAADLRARRDRLLSSDPRYLTAAASEAKAAQNWIALRQQAEALGHNWQAVEQAERAQIGNVIGGFLKKLVKNEKQWTVTEALNADAALASSRLPELQQATPQLARVERNAAAFRQQQSQPVQERQRRSYDRDPAPLRQPPAPTTSRENDDTPRPDW